LIQEKNGKVCVKEIIENFYRQYLQESAFKKGINGIIGK
jgi:hypothetical protein